jgi:hypothetical protein
VRRVETLPLDGSIRAECHIHQVTGCNNGTRKWSAATAESTKSFGVRIFAIVNLDSVVSTINVSLQLEVGENLKKTVTGLRRHIATLRIIQRTSRKMVKPKLYMESRDNLFRIMICL